MSKYQIIEKVMQSEKLNEYDKVHTIEMFLKGWLIENEMEWIWREE